MPGLEGTSLGRYRLEQRLGRGGMAEVYLATDQRMHRLVAIKVVSTSQTEFAERFSRETEAMGNLHHDHILPAYDYGEQEPWHYLVMPYVEGGTLSDRLKSGPMSLEDAGEILQQIASGLQYAHRRGLIHRDIKPSNILMRDEHYAYLADFGLARVLESGHDLTVTGVLLGTPEYMAPELSEGPASVSSDTYALAIVLYEMISGRVPFQGDTAISVFWKHIRDYPAAPSRYHPAIPQAVDHVLMRALDKDPQRRYATPLALSQAYQDALTGLDDMPSLYATDAIEVPPAQSAPKQSTLNPTPPVQTPQERLILPEVHNAATPPAFKRPHPPITPAPMPMQQRVPTTDQDMGYAASGRSRRRRRSRSNPVIAGIILGLIFLIAVSGLLAYLTIQTHQQNAASATATAQAGATTSVIAQQTQQVQQAQQTATAISAAATAQAQATRQAIQATATAITTSTPLLSDPLSGPDANGWPDDGTFCSFTDNRYVVDAHGSGTLQPCLAGSSQLSYGDAALQVDVTLVAGNDAGLIFRAGANGGQFYDFEITNQGQFYVRYRNNNKYTYLIATTANSAVLGTGSQNTLLVIARGTDLQFFINHTFVGEAHDSTFASGQIGVVVGTLASNSGEADFTNLVVYQA